MINKPQETTEDDRIRQGEKRGMDQLLFLSLFGAAVLLLIVLIYFAY